MLFRDFTCFLEEIEQTDSRLKITELLAQLFAKTNSQEIEQTCYLLQGRVGPQYEKLEFGLAERLVIKAMINSFSLNSKQARQYYKKVGDLGRVVEDYRKNTQMLFQETKKLSISEVFAQLARLSQLKGKGSQEEKLSIVSGLLQQLDSLSNRYVVRIIVGNLRLGFSEMTILDALSWLIKGDKSLRSKIEKAFNVYPDLGYIAKTLKTKGIEVIEQIKPVVGVPILMAKAERVTAPVDIIEKLGQAAIEPKYDGFRLQIHYQKSSNQIKIFSRKLDEVSYMFPDLARAMKKEIRAQEIIIEGEAVGYNPKTKKMLPFQEIVQRKRKYDIEAKTREIPLKLFAFDLLFVNQTSYLDKPYTERRKKLKQILKPNNQIILLAEEELVKEEKRIAEIFTESINQGLEGIMAKKLTGKYQAGARDWNWIKFKHSYSSKLMDTFDCLVMGYDYGKGKRTGFGLGAFLVGIYDQQKDRYVTIAKIGTGLTDKEWRKLKGKSQKLKAKIKPKDYLVNKAQECDVWLNPEIVVEIRADEITKSPIHTAKLALRFPRLENFRDDKKPNQTTSLKELQQIYQKQYNSHN